MLAGSGPARRRRRRQPDRRSRRRSSRPWRRRSSAGAPPGRSWCGRPAGHRGPRPARERGAARAAPPRRSSGRRRPYRLRPRRPPTGSGARASPPRRTRSRASPCLIRACHRAEGRRQPLGACPGASCRQRRPRRCRKAGKSGRVVEQHRPALRSAFRWWHAPNPTSRSWRRPARPTRRSPGWRGRSSCPDCVGPTKTTGSLRRRAGGGPGLRARCGPPAARPLRGREHHLTSPNRLPAWVGGARWRLRKPPVVPVGLAPRPTAAPERPQRGRRPAPARRHRGAYNGARFTKEPSSQWSGLGRARDTSIVKRGGPSCQRSVISTQDLRRGT